MSLIFRLLIFSTSLIFDLYLKHYHLPGVIILTSSRIGISSDGGMSSDGNPRLYWGKILVLMKIVY